MECRSKSIGDVVGNGDPGSRRWSQQRVLLALIAQRQTIAKAQFVVLTVVLVYHQRCLQLGGNAAQQSIELLGRNIRETTIEDFAPIELQVGVQHAKRGEMPGVERYQHLTDSDLRRYLTGMHRSPAAERQKSEISWVTASLKRLTPDRRCHRDICKFEDA